MKGVSSPKGIYEGDDCSYGKVVEDDGGQNPSGRARDNVPWLSGAGAWGR